MDTSVKVLKPLNKSKTIVQIRQRLAVTGDLKTDSKSNVYDQELMNAVLNYKKRNPFSPEASGERVFYLSRYRLFSIRSNRNYFYWYFDFSFYEFDILF